MVRSNSRDKKRLTPRAHTWITVHEIFWKEEKNEILNKKGGILFKNPSTMVWYRTIEACGPQIDANGESSPCFGEFVCDQRRFTKWYGSVVIIVWIACWFMLLGLRDHYHTALVVVVSTPLLLVYGTSHHTIRTIFSGSYDGYALALSSMTSPPKKQKQTQRISQQQQQQQETTAVPSRWIKLEWSLSLSTLALS